MARTEMPKRNPAKTGERARAAYGRASVVVAIVFGLLYAYILWSAINNLIELPAALGAADAPWALLVLDVALPVIAFALAFRLGLRRALIARLVLFAMGLALLACSTVGSIGYVQTH